MQAKPLLQRGSIEQLLDSCIKITPKNSKQIGRMVQAAAACINSEESRRPSIDEVLVMLRGREANCSSRKKSVCPGNGFVADCYAQLQMKNEMKSHLALAMLGVPDFEDDAHFYCR